MFRSAALQPSRYLELPQPEFSSPARLSPLNEARLFHLNQPLLSELGLSTELFSDPQFARQLREEGALDSLSLCATAYSGHQFGQFNPSLGDGRALLVGELEDQNGQHWEVQLKGCGPTRYSRGFDGRAVLRSVIREYLASEAMSALDIPTTRALCVINSSTAVYREQREAGAMMLRLAPSHLRFGSFEHFTSRNQIDQLQQLLDFCISHYFPELDTSPRGYGEWFGQVVVKTARLMAQWQAAGFCHGVMNTDNFSVLGLTLDYGPYGFMEHYDPEHICNHSDRTGRYAFARQPAIGYWNCLCLAKAMAPLLSQAQIEQGLSRYEPELQQQYLQLMRAKLGLFNSNNEAADESLISALLVLVEQQQLDYSRFMRGLGYWLVDNNWQPWLEQHGQSEAVRSWLQQYRRHLDQQQDNLDDAQRASKMQRLNPKYILRNHLAQQAITEAEQGHAEELDRLLQLLQQPFDEHPQWQSYADPRPSWAEQLKVSCSS